jgi:small subunit ribosomal protein S17
MAETTVKKSAAEAGATAGEKTGSRRKTLVGDVVSTKMQKTIVVEVTRRKQHPLYKRVVSRTMKFYAHDEANTAQVGDVVRIQETRPMSKLKRWRLQEVVRKAALAPQAADLPEVPA